MTVLPASAEGLGLLKLRSGAALTPDATGIEARDRDGRVRGVVVYDGWTPNACQMHVALETPAAARSLLRMAFRYPFEQLGRRVVLGTIPASNAASWRLARHLGFRIVHRVRQGWDEDADLLFLELRREECRYLSPRKDASHGNERTQAA